MRWHVRGKGWNRAWAARGGGGSYIIGAVNAYGGGPPWRVDHFVDGQRDARQIGVYPDVRVAKRAADAHGLGWAEFQEASA